ncbi:ww domain-containing oxidoreductase [Fusarium albosuccineum]|uniref:Ww domain-containing oxidoreductase n=1 Tax=Fusarium albosuccineum TaxID=1237068 RepID=A0A8H4L1Y8_9HYPO|nr:ww domain-containing oxidoreductase [Fusarium albosuccineum]
MSRYAAAHANPQGPGDARPTALQIVQDENLAGKLKGKSVFVTGANQGIGFEAARAFHATGATVFIGSRDPVKGQKAIDDIKNSDLKNGAPLHLIKISTDSLDSVREAAQALLKHDTDFKLNLLILNAGVMCSPYSKTVDGYESQLATNHLGHFLLFQLLKPALLAASTPSFNSRVISVSSMAHCASEIRFHDLHFEETGSYDPWVAYGQSKTANIYAVNEIERRYGHRGLHAFSLHPGSIATNLQQHLSQEIKDYAAQNTQIQKQFKSIPQGAATTVFAALSKDLEGKGGKYLVDEAVAPPAHPDSDSMSTDNGYSTWAYDQDKAAKFWVESNKLVGLDVDA